MTCRRTVVLALLLASCAPATSSSGPPQQLLDRLHFGRNRAGSEVVTDSAWTAFLAEVVTPRFRGGFTVLTGQGQWLDSTSTLERERMFLLEVVHPATPAADSAIAAIIASYKDRFHQEAVLRVTVPVRVAF